MSLLVTGCSSTNQSNKELPFIDVSIEYPEKEIDLTDIADVRYVSLNSESDDYLFKGSIDYVTQNRIVVIDRSSHSILFFSKDGDPISRFNRRGQGPEEYTDAATVMYDEEQDDVYVSPDFSGHIMVYSSKGEPAESVIDSTFFLISTTDGTVLEYIQLPNKNIDLSYKDLESVFIGQVNYGRIRKCSEGVLLYNPEADTIFLYNKDKVLTPYLHKMPLLSESGTKTVMDICMDAGRFQFISIYPYLKLGSSPSPKYYIRDKKTGEIFSQKITIPDYKGKHFFVNPRLSKYYEKEYHLELELTELEEAYNENKLDGALKELTASLIEEEDANNVFVFVDFRR